MCTLIQVLVNTYRYVHTHILAHEHTHVHHIHMYLLSSSGTSQDYLKTTAAFQGPESAYPRGTFAPINEETAVFTPCFIGESSV